MAWLIVGLGGVAILLGAPLFVSLGGMALFLFRAAGISLTAVLIEMYRLVSSPVLIALPLYHAAHRIRFSLYELGIREFRLSMDVLCYGGALIATALAIYVLWGLL